ncbi:hypothetical protein DFH09DRAFT_1389970 [Mycena vulgaris]|nr:hypothetical protein DFH09DRAFT_1389970 [Mycena vulgaris]
MARLPLQLPSDIFLRCIPDKPIPDVNDAPLIFLNVCCSWSTIALSTSSLWATIRVKYPGSFEKLMYVWLARTRGQHLLISLHGPLDRGICRSVHRNAHQVQTLELYLENIVTALSSLKTLIFGQGDPRMGEHQSYSDDDGECLEMLRAAPDLVDCTFDIIRYHPGLRLDEAESHLTHLTLKHLHLGSSTAILLSLTLPV